MTQAAINQLVDELVNLYSGHTIAFPNGSYKGECTVPVQAYYVPRVTGTAAPSMANDRADGWGVVFPYQLNNYFSHESFQPGKAYPKGTILLWNSPHIGIVVSHDGSNLAHIFQQNADPNGAPCGVYNRELNNQWHTCTYALVPRVEAPAPTGPPYQIIASYPEGRKVTVNKSPTTKWGMNFPDFATMNARPILTLPVGTQLTMVEALHHNNGQTYYREAGNVDGYNVQDCTDYVAPPSPALPAPPVTAKPAETYQLLTTIMYFDTANDAYIHKNAKGTKAKGSYIVWEKTDGGMVNITSDNLKAGVWINPMDNVETLEQPSRISEVIKEAAAQLPAPVVVTPPVVTIPAKDSSWKATYAPFNTDGSPEYFRSLNNVDMNIYDLDDNSRSVNQVLHAFSENIPIVGTIEKDRILYGLPKRSRELYKYYAIPMSYLEGERGSLFDVSKSYAEKIVTNSLRLTDRFNQARYRLMKFIDGIKNTKPGKDQ